MKNLKKTLAVVLAFAMVLSMGMINTFAAYSDVEAGTVTDEAVSILSNLGILKGYEDGTFGPDKTVTRAEMATIMCRTLGIEIGEASSTSFSDADGHWAAGAINAAQAQGIINGFPDGTFRPDETVTYEQAVKMIVAALGYDVVAEKKGGYPDGYLYVAQTQGISKNASGKKGDPAKRSVVAILVYNSLEVRLMDQTSWTADGSDEYKPTDDTILSKYLEVQKWEGVVASTPAVDFASEEYTADADKFMSLAAGAFYTKYVNGAETKVGGTLADVDCSLVDADSFLGKRVVAYVGAEADEETGNQMVYAIAAKQNKNKVTTISRTQLVDASDDEYAIGGQISYRKVGSSKVYDLDLDLDADKILGLGDVAAVEDAYVAADPDADPPVVGDPEEEEGIGTDDIAAAFDAGTIELISNDGDDKIDYIIITAYSAEAVIKEVVTEEGIVSFETFKGELDEIDTEDEDVLVVVYKDGVRADYTAIAANDTVSIVDINDSFRLLYASSKTVAGAVSAYDPADATVTIGDVDYEVSFDSEKSPAQLKDAEGTFYLNVDGQIAHSEVSVAAAGNYGMVLAVDKESGIKDGYVMQVVMEDGTVAEYDLDSKAKLYGTDGEADTTDDDTTAAAVAAIIDADGDLSVDAVKTLGKNAYNAIFKFTMKNGKIAKIKAVAAPSTSYVADNSKEFDAEAMSYGNDTFVEETLVFAINRDYSASDATALEDNDVTVGKIANFATDGDSMNYAAFTAEGEDYVELIIGFNLEPSVEEDAAAVIVTAKKTITYNDDEAVQITGIRAGEKVTFIIYDEDGDYLTEGAVDAYDNPLPANPADINKGDVLLISTISAEGIVTNYQRIFKATRNADTGVITLALNSAATNVDESDDIYNFFGTLETEGAKKATSTKFYLADLSDSTWTTADDAITMKAAANYTLVDYTEGTKNPQISKKSAGTSLMSARYSSTVFVRVYDDAIVDVVVYRFPAAE